MLLLQRKTGEGQGLLTAHHNPVQVKPAFSARVPDKKATPLLHGRRSLPGKTKDGTGSTRATPNSPEKGPFHFDGNNWLPGYTMKIRYYRIL